MKSLIHLWHQMARDAAIRCCTSTDRDQLRLADRVEHEGLSFLTITLPNLAEGLQKGLERGWTVPLDYPGFRCRGRFPIFLSGLFALVFDRSTGVVLDNHESDEISDAIQMIRQLSLAFQKVELDCSPIRVASAFSSYIQAEDDVRIVDSTLSVEDYRLFRRVSAMLFGNVFNKLNMEIDSFDLFPKHGPGQTADKLLGNKKFMMPTWPSRLDKTFPYMEYALPSARYASYQDRVTFISPREEIPVRVITVPKTLKSPRIIAIEPTAMQYMQQALARRFYDLLPSETFGMIGFYDQEVNNHLARSGSIDGSLATIDLSEASDRVSNQLVRNMVMSWPSLQEGLDATRSRKADVPGYGVKRLAKYASMGSALCFPVEAMVFLTCVFIGLHKQYPHQSLKGLIKSYSGSVRVFGDDIIVPSDSAAFVIAELEHFGARVNRRKTFMNGKFRESCGKEYFDGNDVSITRFRRLLPTSRKDVPEVVSLTATRNLLYKQGMWGTVRYLDEMLREILAHFPLVGDDSPLLGRHSFLNWNRSVRLHPDLHHPVVKGYRVVSRLPVNELDDVFALQKFFLKQADQPSVDEKHLTRSGRAQIVDIKLGWASEG